VADGRLVLDPRTLPVDAYGDVALALGRALEEQ
jgi:hypothetical protein